MLTISHTSYLAQWLCFIHNHSLQSQHVKSFLHPKLGFKPDTPSISAPSFFSIICSQECVRKLLSAMKIKTASGPDNISSRMLRNTARPISPFLHKLFNLSLSTGRLPSEWKVSNITPIIPKVKIHHNASTIDLSPYYPLYPKLLNTSSTINYY